MRSGEGGMSAIHKHAQDNNNVLTNPKQLSTSNEYPLAWPQSTLLSFFRNTIPRVPEGGVKIVARNQGYRVHPK